MSPKQGDNTNHNDYELRPWFDYEFWNHDYVPGLIMNFGIKSKLV